MDIGRELAYPNEGSLSQTSTLIGADISSRLDISDMTSLSRLSIAGNNVYPISASIQQVQSSLPSDIMFRGERLSDSLERITAVSLNRSEFDYRIRHVEETYNSRIRHLEERISYLESIINNLQNTSQR